MLMRVIELEDRTLVPNLEPSNALRSGAGAMTYVSLLLPLSAEAIPILPSVLPALQPMTSQQIRASSFLDNLVHQQP